MRFCDTTFGLVHRELAVARGARLWLEVKAADGHSVSNSLHFQYEHPGVNDAEAAIGGGTTRGSRGLPPPTLTV